MNNHIFSSLGMTAEQAMEAAAAGAGLFPARVTEQHRERYRVLGERGELQAEVSGRFSYTVVEQSDYPAVGDWVLVDRQDETQGHGIIHRVLSRKSCFVRQAAGTAEAVQVIAANIDTVFLCMSLNADFNIRRVERYLAVIWDSGAVPVVVLTKSDLCPDLENYLKALTASAPGVDVVVTSGLLEEGWEAILPYLSPGVTVAFTGSSGVGKSTLINRLMGEELMAVGGLRNDDQGRHVTTHRQLLRLPNGAMVIDTPGMRELQLASANLGKGFSDIETLAEACRFADCGHREEPGCAVQEALQCGNLEPGRYRSYMKLQKELADSIRRSTLNTALAEKDKMIAMMGSLKAQRTLQKANKRNKG